MCVPAWLIGLNIFLALLLVIFVVAQIFWASICCFKF